MKNDDPIKNLDERCYHSGIDISNLKCSYNPADLRMAKDTLALKGISLLEFAIAPREYGVYTDGYVALAAPLYGPRVYDQIIKEIMGRHILKISRKPFTPNELDRMLRECLLEFSYSVDAILNGDRRYLEEEGILENRTLPEPSGLIVISSERKVTETLLRAKGIRGIAGMQNAPMPHITATYGSKKNPKTIVILTA